MAIGRHLSKIFPKNLKILMKIENNKNWKPNLHFFKEGHWINDPNGLVYYQNEYHLFSQMNPDDIVWGNMHWGHAVSSVGLHWTHCPIALFAEPDGLGYIFSGGGVVDQRNTSGFQEGDITPVVLSFTHHDKDAVQRQSLAYSSDGLKTFHKYEGNPIIDNPGLKDFRDPKIIWVDNLNQWVMTVVAGQCAQFYSSSDLKEWNYLSKFGEGFGCHDGVWECPDLFPLICADTGETKWVLLISINPGGFNGGSAMQYFIGDFVDGVFSCEDKQTRWLDYGTDFYAAISFDNIDLANKKRRVIAWMSNWHYANETPSSSYRSAMTLPRDIELVEIDNQYQLKMSLIPAFEELRQGILDEWNYEQAGMYKKISSPYECHLSINKKEIKDEALIIEFSNESDEVLPIKFDVKNSKVIFDRQELNWNEKDFGRTIIAPIFWKDDMLNIQIVVDNCAIELFINDGLTSMTNLIFPDQAFSKILIKSKKFDRIEVCDHSLQKVW